MLTSNRQRLQNWNNSALIRRRWKAERKNRSVQSASALFFATMWQYYNAVPWEQAFAFHLVTDAGDRNRSTIRYIIRNVSWTPASHNYWKRVLSNCPLAYVTAKWVWDGCADYLVGTSFIDSAWLMVRPRWPQSRRQALSAQSIFRIIRAFDNHNALWEIVCQTAARWRLLWFIFIFYHWVI